MMSEAIAANTFSHYQHIFNSPYVGFELGDSHTFLQYTASALYGLGISNGIYSIYDIISNGGKKLFYQSSSTEQKQQELIWGNPDLTVS